MRVKAIRAGYFGHYRDPGEVFSIPGKEQLGSWMQPVEEDKAPTPAPSTTGKGFTAVHQGGGRWAVKDADGKMDDWRGSKAEAEDKAKALNTPDPDQGDEPSPDLPDA